MSTGTYILGALAQPLLDYLDSEMLELPTLRGKLRACAIQERVPIEKWWQWLEVIQLENFRPGLGVHIGRHAKPHHTGLLGYLMLSSKNPLEALEHFQRFEPLIHNLNPSIASVYDNELRVSWDDSYGTSTQLSNEFLVSAMSTTISTFIDDPAFKPLKVSFSAPPPERSAEYAALMDCEVEFGAARMSVDWPTKFLTREIHTHDPHLQKLLTAHAETLMETLPRPDPFIKDLSDLLVGVLGHGEISAESIADKLGLPLRSFYRGLDQRGLSFRDLLRTIRYPLAKQYLADRRLELIEIALRLGYSDQSAFGRAFKVWHGTTPNQYRRLLAAEKSKASKK